MSNYKAKTTVYEKRANGKMYPLGQVVPNVDERIRKLENFPSAVVVTKPTIDGSLNLPEGGGSIKFAVSAQALLPDSSITKFDYWLDNNPAKTETAALNKATITVETPEGAQEGETFDLYVRAYDNNGSSNVNSVTLTVVAVGVSTPTISGKTEGVVKGEAAFTGSEFKFIGGEGNHDKSDWILYKTRADSVEVWSSKNDTTNKTTCPSSINDALESSESYILKLRYHDATMDLWSEYGSITFTTAAIAVKTPTISGETEDVMKGAAVFTGSPFEVIGVSESNHDKSDWVLVKANAATSEIWSSKNDSINKTTSPVGLNEVLEVSTTYIIKLRYHDANTGAWSDWGQLQFTTTDVFTYVVQPVLKGATEDVQNFQTFLGSPFEVVGSLSGSTHDKSDWVLYKSDAPSSEIWSSRNDTTNKTSSPDNLKDALEVSTSYILKLRYHDSVNDIWSDWGQIEFTTASEWVSTTTTEGIHFIASRDVNNEEIFKGYSLYIPASAGGDIGPSWGEAQMDGFKDIQFLVNGEDKTSTINITKPSSSRYIYRFTFKENDEILIKMKPSGSYFYFATFNPEITGFIKKMLEPLPNLQKAYSSFGMQFWGAAELNSVFKNQTDLSSILPYIFNFKNLSINSCQSAFENCTSLTELPVDFAFANSGAGRANNLKATFKGCTALSYVPQTLFNNSLPTSGSSNISVESCFENCSLLTPVLEINYDYINNVTNFAKGCKAKGTVYVHSGSTTAQTFKESLDANVNVIEV